VHDPGLEDLEGAGDMLPEEEVGVLLLVLDLRVGDECVADALAPPTADDVSDGQQRLPDIVHPVVLDHREQFEIEGLDLCLVERTLVVRDPPGGTPPPVPFGSPSGSVTRFVSRATTSAATFFFIGMMIERSSTVGVRCPMPDRNFGPNVEKVVGMK
jgi:hypothetical protein